MSQRWIEPRQCSPAACLYSFSLKHCIGRRKRSQSVRLGVQAFRRGAGLGGGYTVKYQWAPTRNAQSFRYDVLDAYTPVGRDVELEAELTWIKSETTGQRRNDGMQKFRDGLPPRPLYPRLLLYTVHIRLWVELELSHNYPHPTTVTLHLAPEEWGEMYHTKFDAEVSGSSWEWTSGPNQSN